MKTKMLVMIYALSLFAIFSGCSKKPGSVVEDFYKAKTWEDKKEFILDSEGLKAKDVYDEEADYNVKEIVLVKSLDDKSSIYKVTLMKTMSGKKEKQIRRFLITKVGDHEKIDFKTMIGFNDISLSQYCKSHSSKPKTFWVTAYLRNLYLYPHGPVDVVSLSDDYETINIPIDDKNLTEDIKKLKDIAINKKGYKIQVEISQKVYVDPLLEYNYVTAKHVKFLKLYPIEDE
jgi:hypothetical protein